jgi:hypothetical protein
MLRAQLLCAYILGLYFTGARLLAQKNVDEIEPERADATLYANKHLISDVIIAFTKRVVCNIKKTRIL